MTAVEIGAIRPECRHFGNDTVAFIAQGDEHDSEVRSH